METVSWDRMTWLNEPPAWHIEGDELIVETGERTDFWRQTAYGFVHDSGHFLGAPLGAEAAIEVGFRADYVARFDQAGLMLRAGPEVWIKAGVELADGQLYASAVVTHGRSDWSVAPLPSGSRGRMLTFRASRLGDGVSLRYRLGEEPTWRLLRVAPMPLEAELWAGPMCCSPSRAGLSVRFCCVRFGPPDAQLHED